MFCACVDQEGISTKVDEAYYCSVPVYKGYNYDK